MTDLRIVSEPRGDAEDATFVRDGLALFNVAVTGDTYYRPLAIVWGGWLDLDTLWVAEPFRGQGYGAKLLVTAQDEATAQGCHGVFLTTFSFQARPFYEKFGYEVIADIADYPKGHSHHVLKKTLA